MNEFQLTITKEAETLNVAQPAQETVTTRLNRLATSAGFNNISPNALEFFDWGSNTSTTVVFNRNPNEPYTLVPPLAGRIRMYDRTGVHSVPEDYTGVVGIHRALIGYISATRINTVQDMITSIKPVIDQGVRDLINQFGNISHGYRITMEMPGQEGVYFRDMDNTAAYEIRLVLYKE